MRSDSNVQALISSQSMLALKESRVLEGGGDHTLECGRGLDLLALGCIHIASIR